MDEKLVREAATKIKLHTLEIIDDFMWDVADGLRVREQDVVNAFTVEVCVPNADGSIVWKRKDLLKKKEDESAKNT